jgi:flagellar M-ring protein FliF
MERLETLRREILARWTALTFAQRAIALTAVAVLATGGLLYAATNRAPELEPLFSSLSAEDAGAIVERLREERVPYELADEGASILVPSERVHELRLSLASDGLPSGGGVGFELFDTTRFGESEFTEQVQYRRALEGELARTIAHIDGVESARVHLVLPQRTLLARDEIHATASVVLHLRPGRHLDADQVRGMVHLVASSVRGLSPDEVTLVDGDGRRLAGGDTDASGLEGANEAENLRERITETRERAVQDLLDAALGPNVAVVRVTADVTLANEERVEETYDPTRTATRSFELVTEGGAAGGPETVSGIPGAVSALPGGPAFDETTSTGTDGRRSEIRNFEVTKVLHRSVEPALRLSRLSVAVLVDGTYEGEGEARHFVARSDEDLSRIREIVASAAGVVDERDRISVECVPFAPLAVDADLDTADVGLPVAYVVSASVIVLLLAAGAALFLVLRARRRRAAEVAEPALPIAVTVRPLDENPVTPEDAETVHVLALDFARRDPELAARVVKGWLAAPKEVTETDAAPAVEA